ncbi:hypothetical protein PHMEG_0005809 [Phytophthora megakarya]|uniref:Uncharacterized protein n=1 Tax=Phytophthora megakarya TaxID=4795 RepID=A0A225WQ91_9STRA|nr:hypothetical protein PHMEG_0005809 [Phytophthora megakarya]
MEVFDFDKVPAKSRVIDGLISTNSNFIDSGGTMNAVGAGVCERAGLRDSIKDHGLEMPIKLAHRKNGIYKPSFGLHLFIEDSDPYRGDFVVLPVPEQQDILLRMP